MLNSMDALLNRWHPNAPVVAYIFANRWDQETFETVSYDRHCSRWRHPLDRWSQIVRWRRAIAYRRQSSRNATPSCPKDNLANSKCVENQQQRRHVQDADVPHSVFQRQYYKKIEMNWKWIVFSFEYYYLLVYNLYRILSLMTWKTFIEDIPGHGAIWLIANLLSVNDATDRTLDK